jgi:hypothetical protein
MVEEDVVGAGISRRRKKIVELKIKKNEDQHLLKRIQ